MILKRLEKNGKIKAMYSSSTVCASTYDTATKDLTVIFNNGGQYKYPNVELTDYTRFETADSTGSIFNTYVKKKYTTFEKLDKVSDATLKVILSEVAELKTAEDKSTLEGKVKVMMSEMVNMLSEYISTGTVNQTAFTKLQTKMVEYDKVVNPKPILDAVS